MNARVKVSGFGLIIVGNEILDGRVRDKHFANTLDLLAERNLALAYALCLPDDAAVIESQLCWAMGRADPFFCCGGIGSTPDDLTRDCAARAAGVSLELHPEGVAILKERFGKNATPARLKMVAFPKGAALVPNPVNQVPGFSIRNGYFLPGFPNMASAMMAWVLDTYVEPGEAKTSSTLVLPGAKEADLVDLMEAFIARHPDVSFSSLPRFTDTGTEVKLGVSGLPEAVEAAVRDLNAALDAAHIAYENG
jgi:molybdopterin-biosynthesis enzyme MoeA-like protein